MLWKALKNLVELIGNYDKSLQGVSISVSFYTSMQSKQALKVNQKFQNALDFAGHSHSMFNGLSI